MPNPTRQAQLREELCGASTVRYLEGRYDPHGRYSIAPILPPASAWEGGSHSVNCALVFSSPEGGFAELTGTATGGKEVLRIDGNPPPDRPKRRPLREHQAPPAPEAAPDAPEAADAAPPAPPAPEEVPQ